MMMKNSILLILLVISVFFCASVPGSETYLRQCKRLGEYCQMHMECCSGICTSYLYKCTRRHDLTTSKPHISFYDLIESNFGHGSGSRESRQQDIEIEFVSKESADGEKMIKKTEPTKAGEIYEIIVKVDDLAAPSLLEKVITTKDERAQANCKQVGDFCVLNEDCCTKRCHTYAAKCVT